MAAVGANLREGMFINRKNRPWHLTHKRLDCYAMLYVSGYTQAQTRTVTLLISLTLECPSESISLELHLGQTLALDAILETLWMVWTVDFILFRTRA
jgi:hypothetical protein